MINCVEVDKPVRIIIRRNDKVVVNVFAPKLNGAIDDSIMDCVLEYRTTYDPICDTTTIEIDITTAPTIVIPSDSTEVK